MDTNLSLVIGGVALPVFAALVLWALHRVGMPVVYDQVVMFALSLFFAVAVVTMKFYPQFDQYFIGVVTFIYTLLLSLQNVLPNLKVALFGTPAEKSALSARLAH